MMSELWQQIIVGVVVLAALIYLISRSRKSACEKGGCGCDAKKASEAMQSQAAAAQSKPPRH